MSQIIPNLYLGNHLDARNLKWLEQKKINVIINCTKDLSFAPSKVIYRYRVPVHDNLQRKEIEIMARYLPRIVRVLKYHHQRGDRILVHCFAGVQRSATVVWAFLHSLGYTHPEKLIAHKRPIALKPSINFYPALNAYGIYKT